MRKQYIFGLLFMFLAFAKLHSQNVVVEIDGDDLFYTEPGCADCWSDPDARWRVRATTNSGTYNWNTSVEDECGWTGLTNYNWVAPQVQPANSSITISFDGYEADGLFCGGDDNVCGGYTNIGNIVINSLPPCQWNYNTYQRVCGSGTYAVRWSYYYYYQNIDPGTISVDDTICAGDDPDTLRNVLSGSQFINYQWQYSDDNGTTWNVLTGETNSYYDPPAGLANTRWFRRMASTCGGVSDTASNIVVITVNPSPSVTATPLISAVCSGDSTNIALTSTLAGTTFAWTVTQSGAQGAFAFSDSVIVQGLTSTLTPGTVSYIITPTNGLCIGQPDTAVVTVNPIPAGLATPSSATICSADTTNIGLTSNVAGTVFNWTVFQAGVTGGTLGSDSATLAQVLTNTSGNAGSAIYTVTPVANGCAGVPVVVTVTVNSSDDASFTYPSATFCQSGTNPVPTITGLPGGTFFAAPTGLSINPTTGVINLASSTVGTYTLFYATNGPCPDTSSIIMTILTANPNAVFSYPSSAYCQNANNPLPVYNTGASAGIYSAIPSGLTFAHINIGEIDLAASAPGTYLVTNTIPPSGSCPGVFDTTSITILPADDASFTYPSATYCTSATAQTPTITGLPGGVFSVTPSGLTLNTATGVIDPSTSSVGAYTLSYTTNGTCPNTSSITMTITNTPPTANFSYMGAPFCVGGNNPSPLFVPGSSAGIFSVTPAGLAFVHVNTGEVDLANSLPGTYTVTNTIPSNGSCGVAAATTTITINPADDASFVYSSATYCTSDPNNPTPVITGVPGGAFTAVPVGLAINASTGTINLATSAVGTYTLTYTTNSPCSGSSSITLTIGNSTPSATFAYTSPSFCQNGGTNPTPVFPQGSSAGIFSAAPVGLVFANLNTGEIDLTSSAPGTYTVTNNIPQSGNCLAVSATTTVVINAADDASFIYPSATYCQSGTNTPTPTITGLFGGTFSATPNGLSINTSTGAISLGASALGIYTLTYATNGTCPGSSSITMTILSANPNAAFSYVGSPFCQNANNPFPTFPAGASAGLFSATPSGLVFAHVNTGEIDLAASAPGTYLVTNTIPPSGSCLGVSATDTVTINSPDDASFVYSSATYCASGANPTPSITGLTGGTFSAIPPGLAINPATGEINLANSTVGAYMLTYTTNGSCANSSSITMNIITANPAAVFAYQGGTVCQNSPNVLPVFANGASAGIFSATPSGLVFAHVNTGEIDLAASAPGTYTVTNTIPVSGNCGTVTATSTITITPADDASFNYTSATYCTSGTNQTPVIAGLPGGIFSSVPNGLSINPSTGTINLFTSTLGVYTVTYSTNGACPNTQSITMTITNTTPTAFFSYNSPYCPNDGNPFPAFAPNSSAGVFTATPAGLVFENINTGEIDMAASTSGTYNVVNFIPASGTCDSASGTAVLVINPAPVITSMPTSQTICVGGTTAITLSSSMGNTNCTWTVVQTGVSGATPGVGPVISQTLNLTDTVPGTAVYTVTPTSGSCPGEPLDITVNVNFSPISDTTSVTYTLANCGGPTGGVAGVTMQTGQAPFQYAWTDANGTNVGNAANLTNVVPGAYTLTVTDSNNCVINVGTFNVNSTPPVIAQFTADTLVGETPFAVTFTNSSVNAVTYYWDFGTGDTSSAVNPVYTFIPLGQSIVCLTATSATGCIDTTCDTVDVFLNSLFVVPNVFTPNDDNDNDVFSVHAIGLVSMDAEIYNRWGEKIYQWHSVSGGWNGRTTAGLPASAGTYYYMIRATGVDGKEYFEKGAFTLIRSN